MAVEHVVVMKVSGSVILTLAPVRINSTGLKMRVRVVLDISIWIRILVRYLIFQSRLMFNGHLLIITRMKMLVLYNIFVLKIK